jgi:serine/threonine protein kinase
MHRDLKPENFMIKIDKFNKPQIKLIDFGLATYIPKNGQKLKEIIGTKEYAAPEIFDSSGYSEKIDEWAIGVIMFNMLTGLEPFKGDNTGEIKDSVLFGNVKFNYIEDVELRELDKKLLNRYVAKRITCKEALQELKTIKVDRENYYKGQKRLVKKTASVILKKEYEEVKEYSQYWDSLSSKVGGINFI